MEQSVYPLLRPLEPVFLGFVNRSLTALWLVAAVLVLRLVFGKAPKSLHCVLWALVALRLIVPFSIRSPASVFNVTDTPVNESGEVEYVRRVGEGVGARAVFDASLLVPYESIEKPPVTSDYSGPPIARARDTAYLPPLVALWLAGTAAMLGCALVSCLRLRKRVAASLPLGNDLYLCDDVASPFILGVFRPRVYLPSDMDEAQRDLVVAHERAHLKRRDHWWKPLGFLLLSLYWFNPGLWLAYILLCRDIELACDERVLRELGAEVKKPYSEALLACSVPRHMVSACPVAFGEVGVKRRVRAVLSYKRPAFWLVAAAVAACAVAAVCFLTDPVTEGVRLKETAAGGETSYYTISARLRRTSRDMLSRELAADLEEDFARWDAESDRPRVFSSYGPGGLTRAFDDWDAAEAYLGCAVDNPLEGAAWLRAYWSGWDTSESDDADWRRHVELVVVAGRAGVQTASLHAGYRDGETRVQLQAMLFFDRGTFDVSPSWPEYMSFDAEPDGDTLTIRAKPADARSPYSRASATLWLARGGILYRIDANSTGGANDEAAVRATLDRLRAAFAREAEPSGWLNGDDAVLAYVMEHYDIDGQRIVSGKYEMAYASGDEGYKQFTVYTENGEAYLLNANGPWKVRRRLFGGGYQTGPEMKVAGVTYRRIDGANGASASDPDISLSPELSRQLIDDWARYDAMDDTSRALSSHMPGSRYRGFETWEEGAALLGAAPWNPLEGAAWLDKMNYAGADIADPFSGVPQHACATWAGERDGTVTYASLQTGYADGGVRVTLRVEPLRRRGETDTAGAAIYALSEGVTAYCTRESGRRYEAADLYFTRDGAFYTVRVVSHEGEDALDATLWRVLAVLGGTEGTGGYDTTLSRSVTDPEDVARLAELLIADPEVRALNADAPGVEDWLRNETDRIDIRWGRLLGTGQRLGWMADAVRDEGMAHHLNLLLSGSALERVLALLSDVPSGMTLRDVLTLSYLPKRGSDIRWEYLNDWAYTELGHGVYHRVYALGGGWTLDASGKPVGAPREILLRYGGESVDLNAGDVEAFLRERGVVLPMDLSDPRRLV